jgi:hypothetical protein
LVAIGLAVALAMPVAALAEYKGDTSIGQSTTYEGTGSKGGHVSFFVQVSHDHIVDVSDFAFQVNAKCLVNNPSDLNGYQPGTVYIIGFLKAHSMSVSADKKGNGDFHGKGTNGTTPTNMKIVVSGVFDHDGRAAEGKLQLSGSFGAPPPAKDCKATVDWKAS